MSKRKIAAFAAAVLMTCGMGFSGTSTALSPFSNTAVEASAASSSKGTKEFVERMYEVVLGREPDTSGLNNWTKKLNNHTATAADIINGFFFSDEYKGKKKTSEEMVTDCYKAMLDRSPDSTGKDNWKKRLDVGMSIQAICKGFVGSNEFKSLCSSYGIKPGSITLRYAKDESYDRTYFVYRLYKNCLGRNPDGTGLENWCKNIKNGLTGTKTAEGFLYSKEFRGNLYDSEGDIFKKYVDVLYRTLLGREGDSNGVANWCSKLYDGTSFAHIANGFLFSNEFKSQCSKAGIKLGDKLSAPENDPIDKYPSELIDYINKERQNRGLVPLTTTPALTKLAAARAKEVSQASSSDNKNHIRPNGKEFETIFADYGISNYAWDGESIVKSEYYEFNDLDSKRRIQFDSPSNVINEAMKSSTTRDNMLNSNFKNIGVGVVTDKDNSRSWAIVFIG